MLDIPPQIPYTGAVGPSHASQKGALMRSNKNTARLSLLAALALAALLAAGCSSAEPPPAEAPDVSVNPLPTDRAEMQIAAPGGVLPCGLAEVGWGYRVFMLADYPACIPYVPNVTVLCLDGQAQWSAQNVSGIEVSVDTATVTFEVQQEGLCALFPTAP